MIDIHSWPTPNGQKIHIAIEELGLPYRIVPVAIGQGDQFKPEFLALNPNHRIPVIVDHEGPGGAPITIFESGAILIYLAEKAGQLMPADKIGRYGCLQWLMFQMAGVGPMFGQYNHFATYAPEKIPYAIERYANESRRLVRVLEKPLSASPYLAGAEYSIADIATFPWLRTATTRGLLTLEEAPSVARWLASVEARPAVQRGLALMSEQQQTTMTDAQRDILFGKTQHAAR